MNSGKMILKIKSNFYQIFKLIFLLVLIGNCNLYAHNLFNGVNIFEGTTPARASRSPQAQASNPLSDVDPNDSGVDISSFANPNWRKLV